jgi:hypothetical protein
MSTIFTVDRFRGGGAPQTGWPIDMPRVYDGPAVLVPRSVARPAYARADAISWIMSIAQDDAAEALAAIERWGLILLHDARLPSLAASIAGGPIRGSWWGHAEGKRIFEAAGILDEHADVATFKLVDKKVCFVHRRLWPSVAAVGGARASWQTEGLDEEARALLERVDEEGRVRASGKAAKALEERLLVAGEQVHTDSGAHASELSSFARFALDRGLGSLPSLDEARAELEAAVRALPGGESARLPWNVKRRA